MMKYFFGHDARDGAALRAAFLEPETYLAPRYRADEAGIRIHCGQRNAIERHSPISRVLNGLIMGVPGAEFGFNDANSFVGLNADV
jgi:hypothetical protein